MASTYVNDLRIEEQATGENSGTWGTKVNSAFSQIAEAFSYGTKQLAADSDETFTMPDGTSDGTRSLYLKITSAGSLTATRTVTLGPNTVSKLWIIENATTGSQSITIAQGSGGTVTIPTGAVKMVYSDGAGAGAAVVDALTDVYLASVDHAAFGDNKKAIFGAGSDLQIYHDSSNNIVDSSAATLAIKAPQFVVQDATGAKNMVWVPQNGSAYEVQLSHDGSTKLTTTSTGIDVTGTVTADGLTVDGNIALTDSGSSNRNVLYLDGSDNLVLATGTTAGVRGIDLYTNNSKSLSVAEGGDISFYEDTGTTAKLVWKAADERLGIGTDSPERLLHVNEAGTIIVGLFQTTSTVASRIALMDANTTNSAKVGIGATGDTLGLYAGGSVRATVDDSGNLLVGKTNTTFSVVGVENRADGRITSTRSGNTNLLLNRLSSDGDIVQFYKDGTTVGSIGSEGGDSLYIQSGTTSGAGLHMHPTAGNINPARNGAKVDNAIDLGRSTHRFKDLYLSGGAYLGGTGAANKLDDYEEGTWTPAYDTTNSDATVAYQNQRGRYVKIGNFVSITWYLEFGTVTSAGTGSVKVTGVPFQAETNNDSRGVDTFYNIDWDSATYNHPVSYLPSAATSALQFLMTRDSGAWAVASTTNMTVSTNDIISGSMTFRV